MNFFPNWAKNILFLIVYIFSGLSLILIINGLVTGEGLTPFNTAVEEAMNHLRTPLLTSVMIVITNIGSPLVLCFFAIILGIILLLHRDTYDTLLYLVSIALAVVSFSVLKNSFHIARPGGGLVSLSGWSFPSGHATVATAFFFATAYSFFGWSKSWLARTGLILFCIVAASLISFSRLYLGAHFALDVLAGISLGLLSVSFTALVFNIFLDERSLLRRRRFRGL